jgi:hypothetical protein
MCLPTPENAVEEPPAGLVDLHQTRNDVVAEVLKAPKRRIDNVVTHLNDSVHQLQLHATILNDVRLRFRRKLWEHRIQQAAATLGGAGLTSLALYANFPLHLSGISLMATILGVGGLTWYNSAQLQQYESYLTTPEELSAAFQRTHARQVLQEADEYTASVWQRIQPNLMAALKGQGLQNIPIATASELNQLRAILDKDIPALRRVASPTHYGKKTDADAED